MTCRQNIPALSWCATLRSHSFYTDIDLAQRPPLLLLAQRWNNTEPSLQNGEARGTKFRIQPLLWILRSPVIVTVGGWNVSIVFCVFHPPLSFSVRQYLLFKVCFFSHPPSKTFSYQIDHITLRLHKRHPVSLSCFAFSPSALSLSVCPSV